MIKVANRVNRATLTSNDNKIHTTRSSALHNEFCCAPGVLVPFSRFYLSLFLFMFFFYFLFSFSIRRNRAHRSNDRVFVIFILNPLIKSFVYVWEWYASVCARCASDCFHQHHTIILFLWAIGEKIWNLNWTRSRRRRRRRQIVNRRIEHLTNSPHYKPTKIIRLGCDLRIELCFDQRLISASRSTTSHKQPTQICLRSFVIRHIYEDRTRSRTDLKSRTQNWVVSSWSRHPFGTFFGFRAENFEID